MPAKNFAIVTVATLGLLSGCAGVSTDTSSYDRYQTGGGAPEVVPRRSGEIEVRMPDGCTALYDNRGNLINRDGSCSSSELRRTDEAAASYLREQGANGQSGRPRQVSGTPEVVPRRSGEIEVRMPDGCTALYDQRGNLINRGSSCSSSDRRRADEAAASYFREQGTSGGYSPERETPPEIMMGKNREAEVIFKNNCVVYYDARGKRKEQLPQCSGNQVRRADQAIAAYRREQGF